jgi:SAM-dependent methyltransferase
MSPLSDESRRSEFFKFPPRKDSEVSYSSSSGVWSFAPAFGTAIVPGKDAPMSEDELWNEYDDLIDEVLTPVSSRTSQDRATVRSPAVRSQHPSLEHLPLRPKAMRESSQSDCSGNDVSYPSLHLRRSRLLAVLHSTQSPTSSVSFSEFIQGYGERKISVVDPVTGRLSLPASPRLSTGSNARRSTRSSLPASLPLSARQSKATIASRSSKDRDSAAANRYRDSRLMEIAETQADGLVSMANLRFGALMTSKWLSFGRVLFSPIHFELKDPNEDRVLVIDGLGKDWSYYCALTYPEATVYDLGPGASSAAISSDGTEPWSTLRNHRHICHESLNKALPFPMHFFAGVVLRFPTALPSSVHRFVLSEAKRVLRPGGYLEFSVLDLDLVNMGNRARRAVRGLKMRMQVADENTSLRNISDEIMAGLGRKGFVECNRCVVGVPVAGKLPSLDETRNSASKRTGSTASSNSKKSSTLPAAKGPKPEVSFSDLLNVSSPSESTDNGITDMVARVGRWWYSRCYESLVLPEAGEPGAETSGNLLENSIWRDENLITECEKRGTSFKMLIGYAQKPEIGVRRTVSV